MLCKTFHDAMSVAVDDAIKQAQYTGVDWRTVNGYVEGERPEDSPLGMWVAGACPDGVDCSEWPRVEYVCGFWQVR